MSKTEDYLDNLLNSVEHAEQPQDEEETTPMGEHSEFFDDFEREIMSGTDEDFLREFERELAEEEAAETDNEAEHSDPFFDNLDGIVSSVKASMKEKEEGEAEDDFMIDTMSDIAEEEPAFGLGEESYDMAEEPVQEDDVDLDPDLMDLLKSEGEFSEMGEAVPLDEMDMENAISDFGLDEMPMEDAGLSEPALDEIPEEGEKPEKNGFLKKLSRTLFGEDEDEEDVKKAAPAPAPAVSMDIGDMSDENLQILQELDGTLAEIPEVEAEEEDPAEKKKREKAEKKAKKKEEQKEKKAQKEKEKAEKKAKKANAPKKPKKPKEPDNTPPLPKKPVILIFIMTASFLALVLIGTNLFGYSNSMEAAKQEYELGNYEQALQEIFGMEIKEEDEETYQKIWLMANAASQYSAYQSFMESGLYDMALDSLIRAIGKCEKYRPDAQLYGCEDALDKVQSRAVDALSGFGITRERAIEMYGYKDRDTYSVEIYRILEDAGLKVTE